MSLPGHAGVGMMALNRDKKVGFGHGGKATVSFESNSQPGNETQRLCGFVPLCETYKDPFRVHIKPPLLGVVVDFSYPL